MINLYDENNCFGCSLCVEICPKRAITYVRNKEGFMHPSINGEQCVGCKMCQLNCPPNNALIPSNFNQQYFAFSNNNLEEKNLSTSGGLFYKMAQKVIEKNGFVFGAVLTDNLKVIHVCADTIEKVQEMRGSKYLQSDIADCFKQVAEKLSLSVPVLFSGTPCQCHAIKKFVEFKNLDCSNLVLCDIICHGVVSPLIFDEYIDFCEKKANKKIVFHNFRHKVNGWHTHTEENIFEDGTADHQSYESQLYKRIFYSHTALRRSCHSCQYANLNRVTDITMGDCWGIEKHRPEVDDNTGLSLVILNTQKGKELFDEIDNSFKLELCKNEIMQPQLRGPASESSYRELFWQVYNRQGFEKTIKKFYGYGIEGKIYAFLGFVKRVLKKMIRIL